MRLPGVEHPFCRIGRFAHCLSRGCVAWSHCAGSGVHCARPVVNMLRKTRQERVSGAGWHALHTSRCCRSGSLGRQSAGQQAETEFESLGSLRKRNCMNRVRQRGHEATMRTSTLGTRHALRTVELLQVLRPTVAATHSCEAGGWRLRLTFRGPLLPHLLGAAPKRL